MMSLRAAYLLPVFVGMFALSACGQNGAGPLFGPRLQPNGPAGSRGPLNSEAEAMAAEVKNHELLYVSNRKDNGVDIYTYPEGKLRGQLVDAMAGGLCSDAKGNIFVAQANEIREYAHGGTQSIAVLRNPLSGSSQFCAVDPTTGNLAVSAGGPKNTGVAIYVTAKASPQVYGGHNGTYGSCTYDNRGNLFVEFTAAGVH